MKEAEGEILTVHKGNTYCAQEKYILCTGEILTVHRRNTYCALENMLSVPGHNYVIWSL